MPARKKAPKKSAMKKRAPARPAARKAAKRAPAKKKVARAAARPARPTRPTRPARPARQPQPSAPPSPPSNIGLLSQHMDYTTHNLADVKRFYTDLLGFRRFEQDPNMNYLYVQTGHSSSVGFMPPMPGMGEPSPAKEPTLYFMVQDVDRAYTDLSAKGVQFEGPPADMPWGHRVVSTIDPEGRRVMLATTKRRA